MPVYYVECDQGCGLRAAANKRQAERLHREAAGTDNNPRVVRLATKDDIAWVRSMGGRVPPEAEKADG